MIAPRCNVRLSIIVPFTPAETCGAALLVDLQAMPADVEIILCAVSGGGPLPCAPARLASGAAVRRCTSHVGRAIQMNAGARTARGRWLWFVHADSRVYPATCAALTRFLANDTGALGYFDLKYATAGWTLMRLNAAGANARSRWLGLPFGDQGFVLRRGLFERLGAYDEHLARGEDHALVWRARAFGIQIKHIPAPLGTSTRNYTEHGWVQTTTLTAWRTATQAFAGWRAARGMRRS